MRLSTQNDSKSHELGSSFKQKLYKRRWSMLLLFSLVTFSNAFQWIHLNIIANSVVVYWNGSLPSRPDQQSMALSWLTMIYMLVFIFTNVPVTWMIKKYGLRVGVLNGALFNMLGAAIKCVSLELANPPLHTDFLTRSSFALLMAGQAVTGLTSSFVLSMPAELAVSWFSERELTLATSLGVFANQFGVAVGFAVPPQIVTMPPDGIPFEDKFFHLKNGLRYLLHAGAVSQFLVFLLVMFYDDFNPTYCQSVRLLLTNRTFMILTLAYGVNAGVYYAVSTLLNVILTQYFPGEEAAIGWAGFVMVAAGLVGSMAGGLLLAKTAKFKCTFVAFYLLSLVSFGCYVGSTYAKSMNVIFFTMFLLGNAGASVTKDESAESAQQEAGMTTQATVSPDGQPSEDIQQRVESAVIRPIHTRVCEVSPLRVFKAVGWGCFGHALRRFFQTGILPIGFEYGAELSYPVAETLSCGLLNTCVQVLGILLTVVSTAIQSAYHGFGVNACLLVFLALPVVILPFMREDLRRKNAEHFREETQLVQTPIGMIPDGQGQGRSC